MTSLESKAILNLRFPLMLGVVLIHCVVIDPSLARSQGFVLTSALVQLCSFGLTSPCVPLFFFISGYLFFYKYPKCFTVGNYGNQLCKRIRSILVPYLFWNLVVLGYFACIHRFVPLLVNPAFNNVYQYSWLEWLRSFWDYPGNQPICFQFWFLRDLMVVMVCSPLIYVLANYGRQWVVFLAMAIYLYSPSFFTCQMAFTFFTIGATFAIHQWNFADMACRCVRFLAPVWVVGLVVSNLYMGLSDLLSPLLAFLGGIVYLWLATLPSPQPSQWMSFLSSGSFFIYAFHGFPLGVLTKLASRVLQPSSDLMWLLIYVGSFFLIVSISLVLFWFLRKILPNFATFITGGR